MLLGLRERDHVVPDAALFADPAAPVAVFGDEPATVVVLVVGDRSLQAVAGLGNGVDQVVVRVNVGEQQIGGKRPVKPVFKSAAS